MIAAEVEVFKCDRYGQSFTLRALTKGNSYQKYIVIEGVQFFIRRMSNDDQPAGYFDFIREIALAGCPT